MKELLFTVILSIILVSMPHSHNAEDDLRIIGGQPTTIRRVPYIVYLRQNGAFICGGTLISRRFVVTAGHCVVGAPLKDMTVTGGATFLTRPGAVRQIAKVIYPRNYNHVTLANDIAVIKLSSSMRGGGAKPIALCSHRLKTNDAVRVSGWGLTKPNGIHSSARLRTVVIRMQSRAQCKKSYRGKAVITNSMMCAGMHGGKDACAGDSGGPLVHKGQLCGVVSWGIGCAQKAHPGVYTNINSLKSFIRGALKQ